MEHSTFPGLLSLGSKIADTLGLSRFFTESSDSTSSRSSRTDLRPEQFCHQVETYLPSASWRNATAALNFYAKRAHDEYKASPENATQLVNTKDLTEYEKQEIKHYEAGGIYYTGLPLAKKQKAPVSWNHGPPFDDENGHYAGNIGDHMAYRYQILKLMGRGSFSSVFRAIDWRKKVHVAIKVIQRNDALKPYVCREVNILLYLNNGDPEGVCNAVPILGVFWFRGHTCMVFEVLFSSFASILDDNNNQGLPMPMVQKVACRLLKFMEFMHTAGVVHADLKPENIMTREKGRATLKVIDFGWSWLEGREKALGDYFQSRFYRAPEVIFKGPLTPAVDMWSYGCIIAEVAAGYPIFTGDDKSDQMVAIMEVLGIPPPHVYKKYGRVKKDYFSARMEPYYCRFCEIPEYADSRFYTGSMNNTGTAFRGAPGSKHIRAALRQGESDIYPEEFVDFLLRCFEWDPAERMTPAEAAYHTFVADLYMELTE